MARSCCLRDRYRDPMCRLCIYISEHNKHLPKEQVPENDNIGPPISILHWIGRFNGTTGLAGLMTRLLHM